MPTLIKKDGYEERTITVRSLAFGVAKNGARYARVQDDRGVLYFAWNGIADRLKEGAAYLAVIDVNGDRMRLVHVEPLTMTTAVTGAAASATAPSQPPQDVGPLPVSTDPGRARDGTPGWDQELAIIRQSCVKAACELYAGSGDVDGALRAADALLAWVLSKQSRSARPTRGA